MKIYYIFLAVVVGFIIFWRLRKKGCCMPGPRVSQKPSPPKKDPKKLREQTIKRIKKHKGKDPKDLDLFGDFIDKEKKKREEK